MNTQELLDDLFTYHAPTDEQKGKYDTINETAKKLARAILENCPAGPYRDASLLAIANARMLGNAAIATKSGGKIPG